MTDKELLELAAKAAGWKHTKEDLGNFCVADTHLGFWQPWNPLTDDGDALRLAVKLRILIDIGEFSVVATNMKGADVSVRIENDPYAATRRAIVRASAEIGKEM